MKIISHFGKQSVFSALLLILIGLATSTFAQPGSLDTTFGSGGSALIQVSTADDQIQTTLILPDNKILVAGYSEKPTQFTIARYNSEGIIDTSFGTSGITKITFNDSSQINSIAVQSDGKIIAGGTVGNSGGFALARFNSNGTIDTTFGGNGTGKVVTTVGSMSGLNAIAVQSDNKIIAVGYSEKTGDFAVLRYNSNGTPDNSFGTNGQVITDFYEGDDRAYAVKIQSDGKIVVSGQAIDFDLFTGFGLARYNSDGSLDTAFGDSGKITTATDCWADGMDIQPDGKIVVTGSLDDIYLARYTSGGVLDSTFGSSGIVITNIGGNSDNAYDLKIDSYGGILVTGSTISNGNEDLIVARYLSSGSLDPAFDNGDGIAVFDFGSASDISTTLAIQGGKIIFGGSTGNFGNKQFILGRLNGFQPTAANVTVSGRITNSIGSGVPQVRMALADLQGNVSYAMTSSFGYYYFYNVPSGQTYVVTPNSNRYSFSPTSLVINVLDDYTDGNFTANE